MRRPNGVKCGTRPAARCGIRPFARLSTRSRRTLRPDCDRAARQRGVRTQERHPQADARLDVADQVPDLPDPPGRRYPDRARDDLWSALGSRPLNPADHWFDGTDTESRRFRVGVDVTGSVVLVGLAKQCSQPRPVAIVDQRVRERNTRVGVSTVGCASSSRGLRSPRTNDSSNPPTASWRCRRTPSVAVAAYGRNSPYQSIKPGSSAPRAANVSASLSFCSSQRVGGEIVVVQRILHRLEPTVVHDVVRVAEQDDLTPSCLDAGVAGPAGTRRPLRKWDDDDGKTSGEPVDHLAGAVGRSVVHHDDLPVTSHLLPGKRLELVTDRGGGIASRYYDAGCDDVDTESHRQRIPINLSPESTHWPSSRIPVSGPTAEPAEPMSAPAWPPAATTAAVNGPNVPIWRQSWAQRPASQVAGGQVGSARAARRAETRTKVRSPRLATGGAAPSLG